MDKKLLNSMSSSIANSMKKLFDFTHNSIVQINNSKIFAGLMIITLNIASRFVTIKLSKSLESYLKFTFSKQILVFAIAWMGTRDIYIAFFITMMFIVMTEYLLNENSQFCCLPETFKNYHLELLDNEHKNKDVVTEEEIKKAKEILEKANNQNGKKFNNGTTIITPLYSYNNS